MMVQICKECFENSIQSDSKSNKSKYGSQSCKNYRSHADSSGFNNGIKNRHSACAEFVCKFNQKNSVPHHDSSQGNNSHHAHNAGDFHFENGKPEKEADDAEKYFSKNNQ